MAPSAEPLIAVVIPCYRVSRQILGVLARIGGEVQRVIVVDDACPEQSGQHVQKACTDPRVHVLFLQSNQGVGGAVLAGYRAALDWGADVIVKIDGDGQMDPGLIPAFVGPIVEGVADYTKGNRFFFLDSLAQMPRLRLIGNAGLSFLSKFSSGYWDVFDPTNGFTAIHAAVAAALPLERISRDYFFESDLLFRLSTLGAVVVDIPMDARYGDEHSGLNPLRAAPVFLLRHLRNLAKRIFYNYFLRNFNVASVQLVLGLAATGFGGIFGLLQWADHARRGVDASAGTVMVAALPILLGIQLLLFAVAYDMQNIPRYPYHKRLGRPGGQRLAAPGTGRGR